jgi:hypothetical protein
MQYLFLDKLIDRGTGNNAQYSPGITWPLRSPDFNPCDFFLWGFMEEQVYAKKVNNKDVLLMRINNVADIIRQTPNVLEKTWSSLHRRVDICIEVNGSHIEQLL